MNPIGASAKSTAGHPLPSPPEVERVWFASLKLAVAHFLFQPWVGRVLGALFRDRIPSGSLEIDTSQGVSAVIKAQIFWRAYESAEIRFVRRFMRREFDVVELGSSIGVVSCHIARSLNPGRRLLCVEANPNLAPTLASNLAINAPTARATIIRAAINSSATDQSGLVAFNIGSTNLDSALHATASRECVMVHSTTLSQLLSDHGVAKYVLVSDIEGGELGILLHEPAALRECQQLIIEIHESESGGRSYPVDELVNILEHSGFVLKARRGDVCVFAREDLGSR